MTQRRNPVTERAAAGRPPIAGERMQRKLVTLDDETIRVAQRLGDGNLSAGLRAAVRAAARSPAVSNSPATVTATRQ